MATTISGTNGVSQVQDGIVTDGKLDLTANSAEVKEALNASGTAPVYACRAWVNFDGTSTVSIRASGNVSSITDNGTGTYTVNFTTVLPDNDYAVVGATGDDTGGNTGIWFTTGANQGSLPNTNNTTSSFRVQTYFTTNNLADPSFVYAAIFR